MNLIKTQCQKNYTSDTDTSKLIKKARKQILPTKQMFIYFKKLFNKETNYKKKFIITNSFKNKTTKCSIKV